MVKSDTQLALEDGGGEADTRTLVSVDERDRRINELTEIMKVYNDATANLQESHDVLCNEVSRLQRELVSTNVQLQRSKRLAALGEMAAGIAHEIRNPLGAITLYLDMLKEDIPADDFNHEIVLKTIDAVTGLGGIVDDVLDFSGDMRLAFRPVCLWSAIDRAVEAHRPGVEGAKVEILYEGRDGTDGVKVQGDVQSLGRVLLNLFRNAVDAVVASQGRKEHVGFGSVKLSVALGDGVAVFRVADSGLGIEEESIERIFNPFFTTRSTGTGLGLAIVHRIIDGHGGAITVYNDGGAVFEVSLPLAKVVRGEEENDTALKSEV